MKSFLLIILNSALLTTSNLLSANTIVNKKSFTQATAITKTSDINSKLTTNHINGFR